MEGVKIKVLDVLRVPGRVDLMVAVEFAQGSVRDLSRSGLFKAVGMGTWRVKEVAHASPPQPDRAVVGLERVLGDGELVVGMELTQCET